MTHGVDPFVIRVPDKFANDPEVSAFFDYFVRWAHDIWVRTGGGDDAISSLELESLYELGIGSPRVTDLMNQLNELENLIEAKDSRIKFLENESKRYALLLS